MIQRSTGWLSRPSGVHWPRLSRSLASHWPRPGKTPCSSFVARYRILRLLHRLGCRGTCLHSSARRRRLPRFRCFATRIRQRTRCRVAGSPPELSADCDQAFELRIDTGANPSTGSRPTQRWSQGELDECRKQVAFSWESLCKDLSRGHTLNAAGSGRSRSQCRSDSLATWHLDQGLQRAC